MNEQSVEVDTPSPAWRSPARKVVIVLPAYNEQENLASLLEAIDQAMFEINLRYEVLLVDDGSTDDTVKVAQQYAKSMPLV